MEDLVGDSGIGTGIPGVCILHLGAQGNPDTGKTVLVYANVNCTLLISPTSLLSLTLCS
jgi:hypothetical protein